MENTIAYRLKKARKDKNLTQDELAALCGISRQTIFEYEKGIYIPKLDNAGKLSIALGVSLDYICFGIPSKTTHNQTYTKLMTSFLNLCNSSVFNVHTNSNDLILHTSDSDFITFYNKLNSIFSLETSLNSETYNNALNDILSNYNHSPNSEKINK